MRMAAQFSAEKPTDIPGIHGKVRSDGGKYEVALTLKATDKASMSVLESMEAYDQAVKLAAAHGCIDPCEDIGRAGQPPVPVDHEGNDITFGVDIHSAGGMRRYILFQSR